MQGAIGHSQVEGGREDFTEQEKVGPKEEMAMVPSKPKHAA